MNASRIVPIPLTHVVAELLAGPLSEAGLPLALTELRADLSDKETQDLWRTVEQRLLSASPSVSLDELVAMRDDLWFRDVDEAQPLALYVQSMAQRFLRVEGTVAVPQLGPVTSGPAGTRGESAARDIWRWLSLALPPDLFLAALSNSGSPPREIATVSPLLACRLADEGFAETHLHLNAGFDFGRIWVSSMRALAESKLMDHCFANPGASLNEGRDLALWLLHAAITRYVLAGYLAQTKHKDFCSYLEEVVLLRLRDEGDVAGSWNLMAMLDGLYRGLPSREPGYAVLRSLYCSMIDARSGLGPKFPEDVWDLDPIAPLLGGSTLPTPEVVFVAQGLRYLENRNDKEFAVLFWQVVRVRCVFYRHLVQRPMTPGLQWFIRFFKRIKPTRSLFGTELKARTAAELSGRHHGLRSLEIRTSPEPDLSLLYREIRDLQKVLRPRTEEGQAERPGDPIELGIVLHFARDRGGGWFGGKPTAHWVLSHADPQINLKGKDNPTGYRYGSFYQEKRREAQAAVSLLSFFPLSLEVVRGLDLCTDEAGVPSWVLAPLLRYVRDAGKRASVLLWERFSRKVPALRTSVHAGEDFVHLLSGLRRLDEALDYLGFGEGDRLGHALSLGVEPRFWAERAGRVAMPREERLLDLAWEWAWYARQGDNLPGGRHVLIQKEIAEISRDLFKDELAPWEVNRLVRDLHDEKILRFLGFPDGRPPTDPGEHKRALAYLTDPAVFRRGREIVWIDPGGEISALQHLQDGLRRKVGRMGLTIEVNPSSNLLIGHLGEIGHHPLWRLAPPGGTDEVPPLSVCIGSDDPLTFATTLREEYQLLYDALILKGYSEAVAHKWIERARKAGLSARFTLQQSGQPADTDDSLLHYSVAESPDLDLPP